MRVSPPALRRRNVALLQEHRRWLMERDVDSGRDSDGVANVVSGNSGVSDSEHSVESGNDNSGDSDNDNFRNTGNENVDTSSPARVPIGRRNIARSSLGRHFARRRLTERDLRSGTESDAANSGNSGFSNSENSANSDNDGSGDSDIENQVAPARPRSSGKRNVAKRNISQPVTLRQLNQRDDDNNESGSDDAFDADSEYSRGESEDEDFIAPTPQKPVSQASVSQASVSQASVSQASVSQASLSQPSIGQPSISSVLSVSVAPSPSIAMTTSSLLPDTGTSAIGRDLPAPAQTTSAPVFPTLGPGSTLQVGEPVDRPAAQPAGEPAKEPEDVADSDTDGISSDDGDDSDDDETTTGIPNPTATESSSGNVQTLTHIVPPNDRKSKSSSTSSTLLTSATTTTRTTLPLSTLPATQVNPVPTTSTLGGAARETAAGETLNSGSGAQLAIQRTSMSGGDIAGVVIGVLAGAGVITLLAVFFLRKMPGSDKPISFLNPFSRKPSGSDADVEPRPKTYGTTWSRSLWDAASSFAPARSTKASIPPPLPVTGNPKTFYNSKTNSEMIDDLVKASYAAENGAPANNMETAVYPVDQKLKHHSDLESQFPPSPTSFLNEKAYNALEVWPPYAPPTPLKLKRSSKPPAVTRWLDGILTPRLSRAGGFRPQGTMAGTRWQETGPDGLHPPPMPAIRKTGGGAGRGKSGRMTVGTTVTDTTASSVVW